MRKFYMTGTTNASRSPASRDSMSIIREVDNGFLVIRLSTKPTQPSQMPFILTEEETRQVLSDLSNAH